LPLATPSISLRKLFERLQTALLSPLEFRVEDFERQFTHTATNTLVPVVHKKVDILAREMVVARIKCGGQRHGSLCVEFLLGAVVQPNLGRAA
jgi:hypothetical protein